MRIGRTGCVSAALVAALAACSGAESSVATEVPGSPRGASLNWIQIDQTMQQHQTYRTTASHDIAATLAEDIDTAPLVARGAYSCPISRGQHVDLSFQYDSKTSSAVTVSLDGCTFVSQQGRERSRWVTTQLAADLRKVAPKAAIPLLSHPQRDQVVK